MTDQDNKLLEKLAKLKRHAESAQEIGNEEEAQAFASMVQNLLLKYKLDMTDIQYIEQMRTEPIEERFPKIIYRQGKRWYEKAPDVEVTGKRTDWVERLAYTVTTFHSCRYLVTERSSQIIFVGHKSNVEICEFVFIKLLRIASHMSDSAAKKFRRDWRASRQGATPSGFRESWLAGFIRRIHERLEEERNKFGQEGGNTAIVRVNKEAVEVFDFLNNKYKDKVAKDISKSLNYNHLGYRSGIQAANDIELSTKAVKDGKPNQQLED